MLLIVSARCEPPNKVHTPLLFLNRGATVTEFQRGRGRMCGLFSHITATSKLRDRGIQHPK